MQGKVAWFLKFHQWLCCWDEYAQIVRREIQWNAVALNGLKIGEFGELCPNWQQGETIRPLERISIQTGGRNAW